MNKKVLKVAGRKLKKLFEQYDGFVNVFVDDWRGLRFVFDAECVRDCKNDCVNCPLYKLVKNEVAGPAGFTAGLKLADEKDKKLFGPQRFLNCKTLDQYAASYAKFLVQECETKKEIVEELKLIKGCQLIYSRKGDAAVLDREFKKKVVDRAVLQASGKKKELLCRPSMFL